MNNSLPFNLTLDEKNFFSIDELLPEDYDSFELVSFQINAFELAKVMHSNEQLWVDLETIFVEACLRDLYELEPDAKPYFDKVNSDRIIYDLPFETSIRLLKKLKQSKKFYKIGTSEIPSCLTIHSSVMSKDWASAIKDVKGDYCFLNNEVFANRRIKKIVVDFHDFDDSLNNTLLEKCLKELGFYNDETIEYEYNYNYDPSKCLIDKTFYLWPNCTGC
jgi:hypothetical protein